MKLEHLTFGQLYRLHSSPTLIRMECAYHCALRRRQLFYFPGIKMNRAEMEAAFPEVAARWRRVLDFLKGPELRSALRREADRVLVRRCPGYMEVFRTIPYYSPEQEQDAFALARLNVVYITDVCGVPARVARIPNQHRQAYTVLVETDEFGRAAIIYKTGVEVQKLQQYCADGNHSFSRLFWWVPNGLNPTDKINPCCAPVNTPDATDQAAAFIWKEQHDKIEQFRKDAAPILARFANTAGYSMVVVDSVSNNVNR